MSDSNNAILPPLVEAFFNEVTKKHYPKAQIKKKSSSWLNRLLAKILKPVNPTFLNSYITTIRGTIWVPDNFFDTTSELQALDVISHETQHIIDWQRAKTPLWVIIYLFPQILTLLSGFGLGVFWNHWMALWFICLGFLAPLPALGRYIAELHGYRTTILFARKVHNFNDDQMTQVYNWIKEQLAGKWYYYAWPFPKMMLKHLKDERFMLEPRYQELTNFLILHKVINS